MESRNIVQSLNVVLAKNIEFAGKYLCDFFGADAFIEIEEFTPVVTTMAVCPPDIQKVILPAVLDNFTKLLGTDPKNEEHWLSYMIAVDSINECCKIHMMAASEFAPMLKE